MTADAVRVFEGTFVPTTYEKLLVPCRDDPDGLGPLSDRDVIFNRIFREACQTNPSLLKPLSRQVFDHQKYQLKNSHVIANAKGEAADNMNIEDISDWLAKLGALTPHHPSHVFSTFVTASRYSIASWVFECCKLGGVYLELIGAAVAWNEAGALETTAYPGDCAIDGDGNYPIFVPAQEDTSDLVTRELELLRLELPPEYVDFLGAPLKPTQSRTFIDCQFPKGHCPNKAGRPRRLRETEDVNERRPHFFDTPMPAAGDGESVTYGEEIYRRAKNRAVKEKDWEWLMQMTAWGTELEQLRNRRKKFPNGGFVYEDTLDITRIDIAIRHLELASVEWRKSPSARWVINPGLVSAALERMKEGSLTRADMEGIYVRTRTPQRADWPKWWPQDLRCKHSENEQLERPRRKISGTISKP